MPVIDLIYTDNLWIDYRHHGGSKMEKINSIVFLLLIITSQFILATEVSLDEAYQLALKKTETIPLALSQQRQAEAQVDKARGDFFPTLSASANYLKQNKIIGTTGEYDQGLAKLTLSQSLFAGGKDTAQLNAANANKKVYEYQTLDTKNTLYIQVARAFYAVLSAEHEVTNTKKSIELTKKRMTELQKRKKIGKSRNIEILAAESQHSVLEAQLVAAIGEHQTAKSTFFNFTGLDPNTSLKDDLTLPKEIKTLDSYLTKLEGRPDLLSLRSNLESHNSLVSAAQAEYFPRLDLTANYYFSRLHYSTTSPDWDAGITLTMPLFSQGITKAAVKEAQESKLQAELVFNQKKRNAEVEIHTAYNNMLSSLDQVKALEKAMATTEENYKQQEKDYSYSLATNLDVIQALNALDDTKRALDRTRYQALHAAAELKAVANELEK